MMKLTRHLGSWLISKISQHIVAIDKNQHFYRQEVLSNNE